MQGVLYPATPRPQGWQRGINLRCNSWFSSFVVNGSCVFVGVNRPPTQFPTSSMLNSEGCEAKGICVFHITEIPAHIGKAIQDNWCRHLDLQR